MGNRNQVLADCELGRKALTDFDQLDRDIEAVSREIKVVEEMIHALIGENASSGESQADYHRRYADLTDRFGKLADRLQTLKTEREFRKKQDSAMRLHIRMLKRSPLVLEEWDDTIWTVMIEKAIVHRDGSITFHFYNGGVILELNDF